MINIKTPAEFKKMEAAGRVVAGTLKLLGENIHPGITTKELDRLAHA